MTTIKSLNDTILDESNGIIAGLVSLFFNIALIIATSKVKIYTDSVRRIQMIACILRLLFSISVILCSPTLAYITEAEAVYIVKGGFQFSTQFGEALLIIFVTFVIFSCTGPPMQFIQVVFIVKKSARSQKGIVLVTSIASFLITLTATILLTLGYIPDLSDRRLSEQIVYNLNGKGATAYLIASLERFDYEQHRFVPDPISWACTLYILAVLVCSTIISVACWVMIKVQTRKAAMSSNSFKSQQQLNTVLFVQFTVPFLTIHIPFYVSFLMPLFRVETSHIAIYLPYLFSWCPAISPIVVLLMVKSIREKIFYNVRNIFPSVSSVNILIKPK